MMNKYLEMTDALMARLREAGALKEFRAALLARAELVARDQISCLDDTVLHALRGQLSICFELADKASQALAEEDAKAKAADPDGTPDWPA